MFKWIRNCLDRFQLERPSFSPEAWQAAFDALPLLNGLTANERRQLKELVIRFIDRKAFEGAHGLVVTQSMKLIISLQACLPILELGLDCYAGWSSIIVYPSGFAPVHVFVDEYGVEHRVREELSGEAWQRGPIVLSWVDAENAGGDEGYNPVIHEFAHKLDMLNGADNGFPPLHADMDADAWTQILSAGFEDFQRRIDWGEDIGIDDYAATSPGEFFAVVSEVFFERPNLLRSSYPEVYEELRQFYRQDPLARLQ